MIEKHDVSILMRAVARTVQKFFREAIAPIAEELRSLRNEVDRLRMLPKPKDGTPGKDGRDVDMQEVRSMVDEMFLGYPVPKNGIDGKDGKPGTQGEKGDPGESANIAELHAYINEQVAKAIQALPQPRDGRDGIPGLPGRDAKDGAPGLDGKDGSDGFSLEDFDVETPDDGRTLIFTFSRGDTVKRREVKTATVLDRGIWKEGTFAKGDGVTWGGSFWIAQCETSGKPGTADSGWRLSIKEGRPGKDGKDGKDGDRGPEGPRGKDLTQMSYNGDKH